MMINKSCCSDGHNSQVDFQKVVDFLKIINEPNRLQILCFLRHGEKCVCEIWTKLNLTQNLASHHLKALKDFDLIVARQEGRKIIYALNNKKVKQYVLLLNNFLTINL